MRKLLTQFHHISVTAALVLILCSLAFSPTGRVQANESELSPHAQRLHRVVSSIRKLKERPSVQELAHGDFAEFLVKNTGPDRRVGELADPAALRALYTGHLNEFTEFCPDLDTTQETNALVAAVWFVLSESLEQVEALWLMERLHDTLTGFRKAVQEVESVAMWCTGLAALHVDIVLTRVLANQDQVADEGKNFDSIESFLWSLDIVDSGYSERLRAAGFDPKEDFIQLVQNTDWVEFSDPGGLIYASLGATTWSLRDGSGHRGSGVNLDVGCDQGEFYVDPIWFLDLKKETENELEMLLSFDGAEFSSAKLPREGAFLTPPDDFPSELFIRDLYDSQYLVIKLLGERNDFKLNKIMHDSDGYFLLVPIVLNGDKTALKKVVDRCE